ncbi:ABC transporter substrate-binding protein [Salaquimonas pukyongi]|uniref:ABC transporter substrate-binding protein n=1 Tax=Salaquimonas pukyongi TaxID=2712698 RepID=UPI00096B7D80
MKKLLTAIVMLAMTATGAKALDLDNWKGIEEAARGQTVYFNAWGGAQNINEYIRWAGDAVKERYGVTVVHTKLDDTANAVSAVVAAKAAGVDENGDIDLIWINGENFVNMKKQGLLLETGWAQKLPNWQYVDWKNKPTILTDFTEPTDGLESPWGMAKMVFFHDTARGLQMPDSFAELVSWTEKNPGRFTYPAPPDFVGSSFLKQALTESVADPSALLKPVDPENYETTVEPLFAALDRMHPNLWRSGRTFPKNKEALRQLLADNEIDIAFAFSPAEASNAIANNELPDSVRSFVFSGGTLGNTHFVTIPYNAAAKEGALVFANFLISPEAQARKQDPAVWGDPTVLDISSLPETYRLQFDELDLGIATLKPSELGPTLNEPHASWMEELEKEWMRRYGVAN